MRFTAILSSPPLVLAAALSATVMLDIAVLPILMREAATDWLAYDLGAAALRDHITPYAWAANADVRAAGQFPYLYPPPLALIWGLGFTAGTWAVAKVIALTSVGAFAWRARMRDSPFAPVLRLATGLFLIALAVAQPPVVHDLLLGNVMVFYVAALAFLCVASDRWWAAAPLGFVLASAFKPAALPVVLWLLFRRPNQFAGLVTSGAITTTVAAVMIGPGIYVDYLTALPRLIGLAQPFSGNVGLSSISLALAVMAIAAAVVWTIASARLLDATTGLAVAIGTMLISQPTLGLNYGGVLIPAVFLAWRASRPVGAVLAVLIPFVTVVSPPLAGIVLAVAATATGWRRRSTTRAGSAKPSAITDAAPLAAQR